MSFFYNESFETSISLQLYSDAASSFGFGGLFVNEWFADKWPNEIINLPPAAKSTALFEIYPIVVACSLWGNKWHRKKILFLCNNKSAVDTINKGRSNIPLIISLLRRLTWNCVINHFILKAIYVPFIDNKADALSHFKFQEFLALCPEAHPSRLPCPLFNLTTLD